MPDTATPLSPPRRGVIAPIQYLRGFAAMLVVWHHAQEQFPTLKALFNTQFGNSGVDLFFVISGFIMVVTTAGHEGGAGRFIRKRILRVVPLYWLLTLLVVAMAVVAPSLFHATHPTLAHVLKSLLFIPHESPSHPGMAWPVLVPGWSLNYEMFFYAIFAASLFVRPVWRLALLAGVLSGLVAIGLLFGPFDNLPLRAYTSLLLAEFVVGAVIAHAWLAGKTVARPAVAALGLVVGLALLLARGTSLSTLAQIVGAGLVVSCALSESFAAWRSALLQRLGDASYSLYLTHLFALGGMRWAWGKFAPAPHGWADGFLFMVLGVCFSGWIGWLAYRHLEVPVTNILNGWFDRHASRRRLAATARGPA
ncbi:MAG TPA: acyltransferase [Albitalea sp.]|nr:acyltransferase [Albitalea sp.]